MHMGSRPVPRGSSEILARRAQLRGLRPFPAWNGSVSSSPAPGGSSSLCSVLTDSGALVVVGIDEASQAGSASQSGADPTHIQCERTLAV